MQNAITTLRIQNFKSIKDVTMQPRRVNIIIGEPNVGKSNILEAMSLLGGMIFNKSEYFMKEMIRYQQSNQLFYDNMVSNMITISTQKENCFLYSHLYYGGPKVLFINKDGLNFIIRKIEKNNPFNKWTVERVVSEILREQFSEGEIRYNNIVFGLTSIDSDGKSQKSGHGFDKYTDNIFETVGVRPYLFIKGGEVGKRDVIPYLTPPYGNNLKEILQTSSELRQEVASLFKPYGLKLLLRMVSNELEIAKEIGELMYTYPYSSIADTLQRLIFYLAAIESNDDAVLLFEEPEAHSYPVYVSHLAQRMVESRNNQFFVVTHSPYLITEVLENMLPDEELAPELALFVAYYEDYQTKVRQLSDEEVRSIRRDSLDVFYNMARFTPRPSAAQD